ncbi:hypothetical protein LEP1GSC037_5535 [Leptospira interrogans str. 2006001854]|uniref:Uncharacterized protein n=1 Tax=Leptospira interrogans str. 2006001854 TaxID=1001590 RepID=M6GAV9_LEPIR|nr:hypothetical protein LEP1GSC037_5535 [Leptospira interrogans str. 2006001854]
MQNETKFVGTTANPRFYSKNSEIVGTTTFFISIEQPNSKAILC